jgi:hypothetical protein
LNVELEMSNPPAIAAPAEAAKQEPQPQLPPAAE